MSRDVRPAHDIVTVYTAVAVGLTSPPVLTPNGHRLPSVTKGTGVSRNGEKTRVQGRF